MIFANKSLYLSNGPRLLLITTRKSYTGSRLAPNSMTLNAKIGGSMVFLAISGCDTSLYHSQGGATELSLCAFRHDCNKGVVFYPKFP